MTQHWDNFRGVFKKLVDETSTNWKVNEYYIFFEIETMLYLYETLASDISERNAKHTWALISGYYVTENIKNDRRIQSQILNVRQNIVYVKSSTAWNYWLAWYQEQPQNLRLYHFHEQGQFEQRSGVALRQERTTAYQQLFYKIISSEVRKRDIAGVGRYTFFVDDERVGVTIPDALTTYGADQKHSRLQVMPKTENPAMEIDLVALLQTAVEVTAKEKELGLPPSDFENRLSPLRFLISDGEALCETLCIRIDGLFHLVGALGIGKSTVIKLLVYHMATVVKRHVSIIMNTVVEAFEMARWLRLMGVDATPALGQSRAEHAKRVGFAMKAIFDAETVFYHPSENEPLYRWMPKPCVLSAVAEKPIPSGQEPCRNLIGDDGKRYDCPLLLVCPVHQITRDLAESQVWILNPASFIYSRAPEDFGNKPMRLMEAVYHVSDLLIIDEADRVQANWDTMFAPSSLVLGTDDAFLDWLHLHLTNMTSGERRNQMSRTAIANLTIMDNQCIMLAMRAYNLFNYGRKRRLVEWVENRQVTNEALFERLLQQLKKQFPKEMDVACGGINKACFPAIGKW